MNATNPIRDSLGSIRDEIAKRLVASGIAALVDAHNTLAELCGAEKLASITEPMKAMLSPAAPIKGAPRTTASESGSTRVSKWFTPVGKALMGGPKTTADLERALDVACPSFLGPVLKKYPHLFRRNGSGRGSTWDLTDTGRREFSDAGKA